MLDKIHAQPLIPSNLKAWKETACQIDRNHCCLLEVKRAQAPHPSGCPTPLQTCSSPITISPVTPSAPLGNATPMDIDLNHRRAVTQTCYNCHKQEHIAPHCPEPCKERVCTNLIQADIAGMISESVAAALDAREASHNGKVQSPAKENGKGF